VQKLLEVSTCPSTLPSHSPNLLHLCASSYSGCSPISESHLRWGNYQPVPSCCPTSPPHFWNCGNHHTATFKECPARPAPDVPTRHATPVHPGQDQVDMTVHSGRVPSIPPVRARPTEVDLLTPRQPPRLGPGGHIPLNVLVVFTPWWYEALPTLICTVGFIPEMNNRPGSRGKRQAPAPMFLSIFQPNYLWSWHVFPSLFELFKEAATYPSIILRQDPPVSQAHLPSFGCFKSFFPPASKPRVAAYVHRLFLSSFSVLPRFKRVDDVLALDISSHEPLIGPNCDSFRLINAYSTHAPEHQVHSVLLDTLFPDVGIPLLVVRNLNIHNRLSDPLRSLLTKRNCFPNSPFCKSGGSRLCTHQPLRRICGIPVCE